MVLIVFLFTLITLITRWFAILVILNKTRGSDMQNIRGQYSVNMGNPVKDAVKDDIQLFL